MSLKFIKNVTDDNNPTMFEILKSFIFGDKVINQYDSETVYNTGDLIIYYNPITNKTEILQAKKDDITGVFNYDDWLAANISNFIGGNSNTNLVSTSPLRSPGLPSEWARIWFQPISKYRLVIIPWDEIAPDPIPPKLGDVILRFDGAIFPLSDGKPTTPTTKLYFDYSSVVDVLSLEDDEPKVKSKARSRSTKVEVSLTSNNHVYIGETAPTDLNTLVWIKLKGGITNANIR